MHCRPRHTLGSTVLPLVACVALTAPTWPAEAAPVDETVFPDVWVGDGCELRRIGMGTRRVALLPMYRIALYCEKKATDGETVSNADRPMGLRIRIVSSLITAKRFRSFAEEAFARTAPRPRPQLRHRIGRFLRAIESTSLNRGDVLTIRYHPKRGTVVEKNGKSLVTVDSLEFKRALFGIWLSGQAIDPSLRDELLGKR
ncbi:MAG: hypothetical protein D6725_16210 [Planctomycetota bacterium]|nr:MAG: hypothetical protein D6725_16210 [Planctomycetota bacterium]